MAAVSFKTVFGILDGMQRDGKKLRFDGRGGRNGNGEQHQNRQTGQDQEKHDP